MGVCVGVGDGVGGGGRVAWGVCGCGGVGGGVGVGFGGWAASGVGGCAGGASAWALGLALAPAWVGVCGLDRARVVVGASVDLGGRRVI